MELLNLIQQQTGLQLTPIERLAINTAASHYLQGKQAITPMFWEAQLQRLVQKRLISGAALKQYRLQPSGLLHRAIVRQAAQNRKNKKTILAK